VKAKPSKRIELTESPDTGVNSKEERSDRNAGMDPRGIEKKSTESDALTAYDVGIPVL